MTTQYERFWIDPTPDGHDECGPVLRAFNNDPSQGLSSCFIPVIEVKAVEDLQKKYDDLLEEFKNLDRSILIAERRINCDNSDLMDASQEAAHYNYLEDQNVILKEKLDKAVEALLNISESVTSESIFPHNKSFAIVPTAEAKTAMRSLKEIEVLK